MYAVRAGFRRNQPSLFSGISINSHLYHLLGEITMEHRVKSLLPM